jgi:hypothetical protein
MCERDLGYAFQNDEVRARQSGHGRIYEAPNLSPEDTRCDGHHVPSAFARREICQAEGRRGCEAFGAPRFCPSAVYVFGRVI